MDIDPTILENQLHQLVKLLTTRVQEVRAEAAAREARHRRRTLWYVDDSAALDPRHGPTLPPISGCFTKD